MRKSKVNMRLRLLCAGVFGIVALVTASASAQWPLHPAAGTPRASSGRVLLDAPTPRTPDGKPDLSGVWQTVRTGSGQVIVGTDVPPLLRTSQFWNIGAGLEGDLPLQPWAYELRSKRIADNSKDNPDAHCLPIGLTQLHNHPLEIEVTVDDPKAYTKPWTATKIRQRLMPGDELIEFVCAENEKSTQRFAR
jgi:hypothetical protein